MKWKIAITLLIPIVGFFVTDNVTGDWSQPEPALVIERGMNRFGTYSPRMVRVETNPDKLWDFRTTYWVRAETQEDFLETREHYNTTIQIYRGGVTGYDYKVKLTKPLRTND